MSYQFDIVSKIKSLQPNLKSSEQKVAAVILADLQFAGQASINELAEKAGVSEASITRFAKVVGCKDVRDLKAAIVSSYAVGQRFIEGHAEKSDKSSIGRVAHGIFQAIKSLTNQISNESINVSAELIHNCNQLVVFGSGGGATIVGLDAQYRLFRLGINVQAHSDTLLQKMVASTLNENAVVLVISTSGEIPEINENILVAKQYGSKVIAITRRDTTLAGLADISLNVHIPESEGIFKATPSRYALLAVVDALALEVANLRQNTCHDLLRRMKYNLDNHRGHDDRFPLGD